MSLNEISGLRSYRKFVKNMDHKLERDLIHKKYIIEILKYLALSPKSSVHKIADNWLINTNYLSSSRIIRRIFAGREDRGKKSSGLIEDKVVKKTDNCFSLSFFGLLYAIKLCNFTNNDLIKISKNYREMLPYIFNKSEYLNINKIGLKSLEIIADGNPLKLEGSLHNTIPYHELYSYLNLKIPRVRFSEESFKNYISLWFYTHLLLEFGISKKIPSKWKKLILNDKDLRIWYCDFLIEAQKFYLNRFKITKHFLDDIL